MAKYKYPNTLSPSILLMLAAQQRGYSFSDMPDLDGLLDQVIAGAIPIDTTPEAHKRLLRAMQNADDQKAGRVRLWVEDLV